MFYRRKIILALLQLYEGKIDKISLQKLLFLITKRQNNPAYDFIPYKYGCYSYTAHADLTAMVRRGLLSESESHYSRVDTDDYYNMLHAADKILLSEVKSLYGKMSANSLMKHTYIHFPYWAIHSAKAKEILTVEQLEVIKKSRPVNYETILYTIGYEGISLEEYLNRLLINDVKVLVDVRSNPVSMKYGFNKNQLQRFCKRINIDYVHFPEVGIQSHQRQELKNQSDYDKLFESYRAVNLTETIASQENILDLLKQYKRIALTCFEADICRCHRKHLAEAIEQLPDFKYQVKHI